jgi:hypothetical protein
MLRDRRGLVEILSDEPESFAGLVKQALRGDVEGGSTHHHGRFVARVRGGIEDVGAIDLDVIERRGAVGCTEVGALVRSIEERSDRRLPYHFGRNTRSPFW